MPVHCDSWPGKTKTIPPVAVAFPVARRRGPTRSDRCRPVQQLVAIGSDRYGEVERTKGDVTGELATSRRIPFSVLLDDLLQTAPLPRRVPTPTSRITPTPSRVVLEAETRHRPLFRLAHPSWCWLPVIHLDKRQDQGPLIVPVGRGRKSSNAPLQIATGRQAIAL